MVSLRSGPHPLLPGDAFASLAPLYDKPLWLVDRISALLEELAVHTPVLIAIDDVQWADRLTGSRCGFCRPGWRGFLWCGPSPAGGCPATLLMS